MSLMRSSRFGTYALAAIFAVLLVGIQLPALADDEKSDGERLRELLVERRDTLQEAVAKYRETLQGRNFRYCSAVPWINRLWDAELDACRTDEERIVIYESVLTTALSDMRAARRLYQEREAQFQKPDSPLPVRMITPIDYLLAKNTYLKAQIHLLPLLASTETLFDQPEVSYKTPVDDLVEGLKKYRLKIIEQIVDCAQVEIAVGTVTWEEPVLAEQLLLDASLDLEPDQQKQIALHNNFVKKLERFERENDHPHGSTRDLKYFTALRTAAQMELMRITADLEKTAAPVEMQNPYKKLAAENTSALTELTRMNEVCYETGTIVVETLYHGQNLALSSNLSRAKTAEERIRIREDHLEECQRMERMITKQYRKLLQSFLFAKAEQLTAEIGLLRERMRAGKLK